MAIDPTGMDMAPPADAASPLTGVVNQAAKDHIPREAPEPPEQRAALVKAWAGRVKAAKSHWDKAFRRMREDQDFCYGKQWSKSDDDSRYVANLTLRLVAQKTAFLYAKNPKAVARKRERLTATVWDENEGTLQALMQSGAMLMQQSAAGPMGMGGLVNPAAMGALQQGLAIAQDALRVKQENAMLDKLGRTL